MKLLMLAAIAARFTSSSVTFLCRAPYFMFSAKDVLTCGHIRHLFGSPQNIVAKDDFLDHLINCSSSPDQTGLMG